MRVCAAACHARLSVPMARLSAHVRRQLQRPTPRERAPRPQVVRVPGRRLPQGLHAQGLGADAHRHRAQRRRRRRHGGFSAFEELCGRTRGEPLEAVDQPATTCRSGEAKLRAMNTETKICKRAVERKEAEWV